MKIIVDSCCELTEAMKRDPRIISVPLKISVGGIDFLDDESLNLKSLLNQIDETEEVAKTSCPSPDAFYESFQVDDEIVVITLTGSLSGTYNSARVAKDMILSEEPGKKIHIINTNGASIKETLVLKKAIDLMDQSLSYDEIVSETDKYLESLFFFFHLDVLDTLVKNGRMSRVKGTIASLLNIKLIMTATEDGEIDMFDKVRTSKKAMARITEIVGKSTDDFSNRVLGISYCDCYEKANALKNDLMSRYAFKDVLLLEMRGLSSTYSNRGGIIISY